jgi:pyruvate kinase
VLEQLVRNGLDVLRLNFAHIEEEDYPATERLIRFARATADECGRNIAIFQDLGGIKLRIGAIGVEGGAINLTPGQTVILRNVDSSDDTGIIPFPHEDILGNLKEGDRVYLADGTIRLDVTGLKNADVEVEVQHGAPLSSHKGINVPGVSLNRPVMTEKDKQDAEFGVKVHVDWVGISFVQTSQDMVAAKEYLYSIGSKAVVMPKIEKQRALDNIDAIIVESDGVMVARGDLGIEIPMEQVPRWQKLILRKAQEAGKPGITATQMLGSMVYAPRPTRAECADIVNSVLDGTSGILLSDEMAVGKYPEDVLQVAINNILEGEGLLDYYRSLSGNDATEITVRAACQQAREYEGVKIIVITSSGGTAIKTAKFQPQAPIVAITHDIYTMRKLAMVWGVSPGGVVPPVQDVSELVRLALAEALKTGAVTQEDSHVIVIHGSMPGVSGSTSTTTHLDISGYLEQRRLRQQIAAA